MSRARDISIMLSKTEVDNTSNLTLLNSSSELGLDSAQVQAIGTTVYTSLDSLPSTGLVSGQQAWVESSGRLYISNGSGWYNIALVNASPTLSLDRSGTIQLNADTLSVVVTATATDADDNQDIISFSVESDGNMVGTGTSVSQDSSVFTITALSEDSGGTAGDFTLTFKATDQIAVDNETLSFSLSFTNVVDSSAETILLMKAAGNNATNQAITYQNSSDVSTGFTETGTPFASTFSPYRSGGYSAYFDGTGDRLEMTAISDLSATNYTIEMWIYPEVDLNSGTYIFTENSDDGSAGYLQFYTVGGGTTLRLTQRGNGSLATDVTMDFESHRWYHLAAVWDGTNTTIYVDGVSKGSSTNNAITDAGNGLTVNGDGAGSFQWPGYIRDFRISTTARYTSNFTPPTEALTADGDTDVLLCHAPYFGDGSTNNRAVISRLQASTQPFGPYDYETWAGNSHGGSVYFDNSSKMNAEIAAIGTSNFTIEGWIYPLEVSTNETLICCADGSTGGSTNWQFNINGSSELTFKYNGATEINSTATLPLNQWHHVAVTATGGTIYMWVNGVQDGSVSYSHNYTDTRVKLGTNRSEASNLYGYVADVRVIIGTAQYTSAFTPPTAPLSHTGSETSLLMNNKSDANIYDVAAANTLELNSGAQSSTTERKFTTSSSILINGTDDKVTIQNFGIGGDMTFEGWFMQTTATGASYRTLLEASTYSGTTPFGLFTYNTQVQLWGLQSGVQITGSFTQNTWHHVAVVRNSGTWTMYIDGISQGTNTNNGTYSFAHTTDWCLGAQNNNASDFIGYLQDWRFSDRAVYTGNFTPPTTEFEL